MSLASIIRNTPSVDLTPFARYTLSAEFYDELYSQLHDPKDLQMRRTVVRQILTFWGYRNAYTLPEIEEALRLYA